MQLPCKFRECLKANRLLRRLQIFALLTLAAGTESPAQSIYVSVGGDGAPRYATQALDRSYSLLFEPQPAIAQAKQDRLEIRPLPSHSQLQVLVDRIARQHAMSPALIGAIVSVESNYDSRAVSWKGAVGAMQLMPETARRYGVSGAHALMDPERNIRAGVLHLKALLAQHRGNVALALAAYNAGSGAVKRHDNRIPPYRETMLYVPAVLAKAAATSPP